jgi:DNA recombination protein RmuC
METSVVEWVTIFFLSLLVIFLFWHSHVTSKQNRKILSELDTLAGSEQTAKSLIPSLVSRLEDQSLSSNRVSDQLKRFQKVLRSTVFLSEEGRHVLSDILSDIFPSDLVVKELALGSDGYTADFAVLLPGAGPNNPIYLPILVAPTSDFESYRRQDGSEEEQLTRKNRFITSTNKFAEEQSTKAIHPGVTTEYFVLFIPYEAMFLELVRVPGLTSQLLKNFSAMLAGPSTVNSILASYRVAHQRVRLLGNSEKYFHTYLEIKKGFERFSSDVERARRKILEAQATFDRLEVDFRSMDRRLRKIDPSQVAIESSSR